MATEQHVEVRAATGWLTLAEMRTLEAVCEALAPAVSPPPIYR
jgi:hypothetical protein